MNKAIGKGKKEYWRHPIQEPLQIEAMLAAGDKLLLAGPSDRLKRKVGFLWMLNGEDGKNIKTMTLSAPPAPEGMASANGKLYIALSNGKLLCLGRK